MIGDQPYWADPERRAKWDGRFMRLAHEVASWSKDPHSKAGAVLVSPDRRRFSFGYNGFPAGVPDNEALLLDRDGAKAFMMVHAERNALDGSPFNPVDCCLVCTRFPCHVCAQSILARGVTRIVVARDVELDHPRWGKSQFWARAMLDSAHVKVEHYHD